MIELTELSGNINLLIFFYSLEKINYFFFFQQKRNDFVYGLRNRRN